MFEGLNAIPWADLRHAFGSAERVPIWLLRLTSSDDKVRKKAMNALYGSICHQNWICPATAYTVPYLIELLQEPAVQGKDEILELLADIIESGPFNEMTWRHNPRVPSWEVPAHVPFRDARAEAEKGIPTYITLLNDADVAVRMQAAHVLSVFYDRAYETHPILLAAFETETDERAKANLVALGSSSAATPAEETLFEKLFYLEDNILLRFVAARALAFRLKDNTPQDVADFLAEVMLHNPDELSRYKDLPLGGSFADNDATGALYALGPKRLQFLFPLIVQELKAAGDLAKSLPFESARFMRAQLRMEGLATMLLSIVFPQVKRDTARSRPTPIPPRLASMLTDDQRQALTTACEIRYIWSVAGDIPSIMGKLGLPQTRDELAKYLQIELPPSAEHR